MWPHDDFANYRALGGKVGVLRLNNGAWMTSLPVGRVLSLPVYMTSDMLAPPAPAPCNIRICIHVFISLTFFTRFPGRGASSKAEYSQNSAGCSWAANMEEHLLFCFVNRHICCAGET